MNLAQIYADKQSKEKEGYVEELFLQLFDKLSTSLGIPQQFIDPDDIMVLPRRSPQQRDSSMSTAEAIVAAYEVNVVNRNRNIYPESSISFQNGSEIRAVPLEVRERTLHPIINPQAIASLRFDR